MIRTDSPPFGRLITAMVTPFDDELRVDYAAVGRIAEHLVANGTDTILLAGTTGESPTLEEEEKLKLLSTVVANRREGVRILMGTGSNNTTKTTEASKRAESLGADGLLVVAPYYNKPSQSGLMKHFESVANATALPIFIYNIPGRTGVNITAETMIQLSHNISTVHALKDSTGSVEQSAEIGGKARSDFRVYSGDDYLTLPFLSIGASGVVSVASHIIGRDIKRMMEAFFKGDHELARTLHYQCLPLFKGLFTAPNPTCVKYALARRGLCTEHLRLPLVALDQAQREAIDKLLNSNKQMTASV